MLSKTRLTLLLLIILLSACYAPTQTEGTCIGVEYKRCTSAEAAVSVLGLCGEECQAECRAYAVEACK